MCLVKCEVPLDWRIHTIVPITFYISISVEGRRHRRSRRRGGSSCL